ncbi:CidA/LrgA family protein [Roseomonas sp. NAR14]|uniref:CidA/LrgA family protein n=1 Tax=Roseomonas acroporae TaxID=2937791 RepID=A0A9X2BU92_9PROT|nr:CidA/LrgA family protein [Roseomonas acroporae]MCK8785262.1 CidA/LrgA family protein [Roseomonas acroporae]
MIAALATLLCCQLAGELLARLLHLPVPGPVIGMVILFAALVARGRVPEALGRTTDTLLTHLGLLYVPAGVGLVLFLPLLAQNWLTLLLAVVGGTLAGIAATGLIAEFLFRRWG